MYHPFTIEIVYLVHIVHVSYDSDDKHWLYQTPGLCIVEMCSLRGTNSTFVYLLEFDLEE